MRVLPHKLLEAQTQRQESYGGTAPARRRLPKLAFVCTPLMKAPAPSAAPSMRTRLSGRIAAKAQNLGQFSGLRYASK
jgi:hypothetical protein